MKLLPKTRETLSDVASLPSRMVSLSIVVLVMSVLTLLVSLVTMGGVFGAR